MKRPLRFCMISTFYPPYNFGGDGISVQRLSHALADLGHQVEVIHCIDAYRLLAGRYPDQSYRDHSNVTVHGLKSPFGFLSPLVTQQTGFPMFKSHQIKRILEKGFDVIHYHNISLVGGPGILAYGQAIKLYTMQEFWLVCPMHVLFKFNRTLCTHPNCLLCSLIHKRPPQLWRYFGLVKRMVRQVDLFIAPSRFCRGKHLEMGFQAPIEPLPNFIPAPESSASLTELSVENTSKNPYFLFIGRLEKIKGVQTLILVFQRYHKARLLIAGKGEYEPELRRLAGSSPNIRFLGYQSKKTLHSLYQHAIAVIVPSLCFDIFPNVVLEAFTHHTPAIVRNLGGMPEMVEESKAGFIYDTDRELISAMDQLVENPAYRCELGERGYQAYLRNWTSQVHLKRYFSLIQRLSSKTDND